jgi:hypothetical protein
MDSAKAKKLEEYAAILERQAQSEESQGNANEAAKIYVKLIDIFLLLAREAPDHPTWAKFATRAETLQKKTKELIASDRENSQGKTGAIKKMLGLNTPEGKYTSSQANSGSSQTTIPVQPKPEPVLAVQSQEANPSQVTTVPKRTYDQLVERMKELESHASSMVERSDYQSLESKYQELNQKFSLMPSKSETDELRLRLSNSVPRIQYEELQKAIVNLVPKDTYNAAQARIAELESQLENSIPKSILDNLANEISLLILTAEIPMTHLENSGISQIQIGDKERIASLFPPPPEHIDIQDELISMREKIDLLENKLKGQRAENLKA